MFTAVGFNSVRVGLRGTQCAFRCRVPGRDRHRNIGSDIPYKGVTERHVSSWPARSSKLPDTCSGMVSASQYSRAVNDKSLMFLTLINDSAKWVVTLTAGGVLLWHHNVDVSWSLLGSIVTVFLCKVHSGPTIVMFWHEIWCTSAYICWP